MANVTFTFTATPSTTYSSTPASLQLDFATTTPCGIYVPSLGLNASARRKFRNRLNQRARRERLAVEKLKNVHILDVSIPPPHTGEAFDGSKQGDTNFAGGLDLNATNLDVPARLPNRDDGVLHRNRSSAIFMPRRCPPKIPALVSDVSWCKPLEYFVTQHQIADLGEPESLLTDQGESATTSFEKSFLRNLSASDLHRLPGDDHLLSLMYYNVFRALASNSRTLGLDTYAMHADNYPSPFITGSAYNLSIPPHLQPTPLQRTVPHHPCFDIFPDPIVRDRGITHTHILPHGKLCMTLAGRNTWFENDRLRRSGLIIWGPPENVDSWEMTEGFLESWKWLVQGSFLLQHSTNKWRAARGEPPIFFT